MADLIKVETRNGAQLIRINRPEKKNALTAAMYTRMEAALQEGDASPQVAAHVFLGGPGAFSAGNDIEDFLNCAREAGALSNPVVGFISRLPLVKKPMIAAVDGLAVGVGTTLLLHCDLVYATPQSSFRTPFLDLGLVPEAGSSLLAPLLMGHQRAFELLVLGEPFTADRALAAGLVNAIHPAVELEGRALAAARRLAMKPPAALAAARALLKGDPTAISERIAREVAVFAERLQSAEAKEAFTAFLEKRQPDFARLRW
jgi:enoyl-CoA hydratase/carnithine racemase